MLFNSLEFLFLFFPLTLWVALRVDKSRLLLWICFTSAVFYMFAGHAWFLIPMFFTTILDFFVGKALAKTENAAKRKSLLLLSLVCNLGLLAFFKYLIFVLTLLSDTTHFAFFHESIEWAKNLGWVLPAGISFYTFQTISYVIDVYRREAHAEESFSKFLAFVTFFPHLVAGPLTRHNQLIPQLERISKEGIQPRWKSGVHLFFIGLCKKVIIADRIANIIDPYIAQLDTAGAVIGWIALVGYALQIYFDFSGYSDMAIGLGRLFAIELPTNFNSPYQAKDPSDFWRRWHITLSLWLRDYLYISLGGNRCSQFRKNINLMLTMALGGLWHGANLTFLFWGIYHGLLLVLHHQFRSGWERLPQLAQKTLTVFLIWLGWVFFRAETVTVAVHWFKALFLFNGMGHFPNLSVPLFAIPLGLLIALVARNAVSMKLEQLSKPRSFALAILSVLAVLLVNYSSRFLYFQF